MPDYRYYMEWGHHKDGSFCSAADLSPNACEDLNHRLGGDCTIYRFWHDEETYEQHTEKCEAPVMEG